MTHATSTLTRAGACLRLVALRNLAEPYPVLQSSRFKQTQALSGECRAKGFDGIAYLSTQHPEHTYTALFKCGFMKLIKVNEQLLVKPKSFQQQSPPEGCSNGTVALWGAAQRMNRTPLPQIKREVIQLIDVLGPAALLCALQQNPPPGHPRIPANALVPGVAPD